MNVAPEAALSLLVGQAVSDVLHSDPHSHPIDPDAIGMAVATIITFQVRIGCCLPNRTTGVELIFVTQVGLISFLLGFFRLGFLDVVLSRALLRGFVTAVAVVIMM